MSTTVNPPLEHCPSSVLIATLFLTLVSSDVPFIVAHKKATLTRLKSGVERVFASIDIYDQGSACFWTYKCGYVFFDKYGRALFLYLYPYI
ncbi:hypothetical protein ACSBR2_004836 [Camellia fascicularis]